VTVPAPFTGTLGTVGAQLGLFQLGGPPLTNTFGRSLPSLPQGVTDALPFIAHFYANDGVTPNTTTATMSMLNRPVLSPVLANGGYNQLLLQVAAKPAGVVQGNVCRLTEQDGDSSILYTGVVEDFPDFVSGSQVTHQILLSPLAVELDDTFSQAVYTAATDVTQLVRDAVALTNHCSCDPTSVPAATGIMAATSGRVDFRNQSVRQIIDTARSIAGSTWFWHVDHLGRVWFQAMGSQAVYTIPRAQYQERTSSASIQNRKNRVTVIGAAAGGNNTALSATANGSSQNPGPNSIGIRALSPPLAVPTVADTATLTAIANNVLAVLDRIWNRVDLKVLPSFGKRIHASQPGGAMMRYWEPTVNPLQESEAGGGYTGPFITQSLDNDGLLQHLVAGDIPVTSQTDLQNMVNSLAARTAAGLVSFPSPTLSDWAAFQTSSANSSGGRLSVFDLIPRLRVDIGNLPQYTDPTGVISLAEYGLRSMDASGNLIFDSAGLVGVGKILASAQAGSSVVNGTGGTHVAIPSTTINYTLVRQTTVLFLCPCAAYTSAGGPHDVNLRHDSLTNSFTDCWFTATTPNTTNGCIVDLQVLAAGTHEGHLQVFFGGAGAQSISITQASVLAIQLGA
jgi:hypothetical protein